MNKNGYVMETIISYLNLNDGVVFFGNYFYGLKKSQVLMGVRNLINKGYMIRYFRIKRTSIYPKIDVIYYVNKAGQVSREIYDRYPEISKKPFFHKNIEIRLLRNLHKQATLSYGRARKYMKEKECQV